MFSGSLAGHPLNKPVIGIASAQSSNGYWLVGSDGGVFAFGTAFQGSTAGTTLPSPIIGMFSTLTGYTLLAAGGMLYPF